MTRRSALGALAAASVFAGAAVAHADPIQFGVVGSAIDLSANVSEAILPGGTVFQDSHPLFGTEPDPNQSAAPLRQGRQRLGPLDRHLRRICVVARGVERERRRRREPAALWRSRRRRRPGRRPTARRPIAMAQTFVYNGTPAVGVTLHLHIPTLQVGLIGVAPMRDAPSATERLDRSGSERELERGHCQPVRTRSPRRVRTRAGYDALTRRPCRTRGIPPERSPLIVRSRS